MKKDDGFREGIGIAFRFGTEMTVATFLGALMGYAFDHWVGTKPWGLAAGVIIGGIAGFLNVYRAAKNLETSQSDNDDDPEDKQNRTGPE